MSKLDECQPQADQTPRWSKASGLLPCGLLKVLLVFLAVVVEPVAAFGTHVEWRLPPLVQKAALTLPNGDEADVYAPRIRSPSRIWLEDAFPVVVVLQGALVDKSQYRNLGRQLARRGFVVVIPNHFRAFPPLFPEPQLFSEVGVVSAVFDAMVAADSDPESPLYRIIDTDKMGAVGHSLGGLVALEASAAECSPAICTAPGGTYEPPLALKAVAVYGANLVDFDGTLTDLDTSRVPVALVQGALDGIATLEDAEATYLTLEPPQALITIEGANHYGMCRENNPLGATPDPVEPTLSQRKANFHIARWIGFWLRANLREDPWAEVWLYEIGGSFDGVVDVLAD